MSTYREREELAVNTAGLEDVESSKSFGDTQTIVFVAVNDQLRGLPVVEVAAWIVLTPSIQ